MPKKQKLEVFKVQVPLTTNDPQPKALIYNKDRSYEGLIPVTDEIRKMMDNEPKRFFWGHVEGDALTIDANAPWQNW